MFLWHMQGFVGFALDVCSARTGNDVVASDKARECARALPAGLGTEAVLVELQQCVHEVEEFLATAKAAIQELVHAAEEANDVPASCTLHAHFALLHTHQSRKAWDTTSATQFLASCAFVLSWHVPEFGAGMRDEDSQYFESVSHEEARRCVSAAGVHLVAPAP